MQTTNTKSDPKLSEILAPKFADCSPDDIGSSLLWWGYLTGKLPRTWAHPDADTKVTGCEIGELKQATYGLMTVARLAQLFADDGEGRKVSPDITCGLASAVYALASQIDDKMDQIAGRAERQAQ